MAAQTANVVIPILFIESCWSWTVKQDNDSGLERHRSNDGFLAKNTSETQETTSSDVESGRQRFAERDENFQRTRKFDVDGREVGDLPVQEPGRGLATRSDVEFVVDMVQVGAHRPY